MRMGKPNKSRRRRKSKSSSSSSSSSTSKNTGAATTKTTELNNKPKYSSPNIIVGQVSSNVIASILAPKLMDVATQSLELYADESLLYSDYLKELNKRRMKDEKDVVGEEEDEGVEEAEINLDGTTTTTENSLKTQEEEPTPSPPQPLPELEPVPKPKPILFTSQRLIDEFQNEILIPTSKHFSIHTNTWKVYANAAKFERLLDEKYGMFRPFITQHPEIETFFRGMQRKYAMGYFSPFRQGEAPLNITSSIVLLFMMQRNKIRWDGIVLTALFLLVGLQPWALVTGVSLVQWRLWRRRGRKVGSMEKMRKLQVIRPYYAKELLVEKKKAEKKGDESTSEQLKMDILKQPVGTKISTDTTIDDTSNYDTILLGYGPSTLYTAALLSRAGRKVLVLSPMDDASGCVTLSIPSNNDTTKLNKKYDTIPFDIHNNNVTKISKQQKLLVPALCTDSDCQGGIRFVQIGSQSDGYAHEILCIPGMGCGSDNTDDAIPFVLRGNGTNLADDAAQYLGDGWVGTEPNNPGNSATAAYLQVCNAMNASAGQYYQSKLLSDSVQNLQSKSSYHEACIRYAGSFLDKCLPLNPHVRSLMAGIGMREENIKPSRLSMGPHVSNISGVTCGEGLHYPMGGPRALCHALRSVVEQCGGTVLTGVELKELVFENDDEEEEAEEESKKKGKKNRKAKGDTTKKDEEGDKQVQQQQQPTTPSPRCIGVTLANGQTLTLNNTENDSNIEPAIISTLGFIPTFIHLFPDSIRMKHGVPRGFPALTERRPTIQVLVGLKGSAQELNLTGADYYRLPNASLARDVMDGETGQVKLGEIGLPDYDNDDDDADEGDEGEKKETVNDDDVDATTTAPTAGDTPSSSSGGERAGKRDKRSKSSITISTTNKKQQRKTKFETGSSWLKISFPSAKDPTFPSRHGTDVTTCVVTIEADDDFVKFFDAKPKLYSIHRRVGGGSSGNGQGGGGGESARLMERVMKDLVDIYPQLEGKIECAQIRGPHRTGLSHTPERYAAKGIRPDTSYPGLYVGGSDLTIGDSFSAGIIGGWLVANAVMGYTYVDHLFLEKNITSDLERWLDEPKKKGKKKKGKDLEEEEDVAVPYSPPPPAKKEETVTVPEDKGAAPPAEGEEGGGGGGESSGELQESGKGETTAESSKEK